MSERLRETMERLAATVKSMRSATDGINEDRSESFTQATTLAWTPATYLGTIWTSS